MWFVGCRVLCLQLEQLESLQGSNWRRLPVVFRLLCHRLADVWCAYAAAAGAAQEPAGARRRIVNDWGRACMWF